MGRVDGSGPLRVSIIGDMLKRRKRRRVADIERVPSPGRKPRPDAQWNEAAGQWEVWDQRRQAWVCVETSSARPPASRSVDPLDESLVDPPRLDLHGD